MSAPLKEIRIYVPESAHILLSARAQAFQEDIGAIAKGIVMEWVKKEAHARRIANKLFRNTGIEPDLFGDSSEDGGVGPEDAGTGRNGPRGARR